MRDVSYLASDAMMGRATPSPGLDSAAAYVVRTLKQLGVKPMGDSGTYFQHYLVTQASLDIAASSRRRRRVSRHRDPRCETRA